MSALRLSKVVPQHTHVVEFNWCKKDFTTMSPKFREIRAKCSSPMDTCFWCRYKFADGDMMALAQPKKGANKVLCQTCAAMLLDKETRTSHE